MEPITDQGGFAKSGRGGDEGQLAVQALVQSLNQVGARDKPRAGLRDIKLGLQQGCIYDTQYIIANGDKKLYALPRSRQNLVKASLQQFEFSGSGHRLRAAVDIQLAIDAGSVRFDRAHGNDELLGNFLVRQAVGNQA